jgi:hypothetical protein
MGKKERFYSIVRREGRREWLMVGGEWDAENTDAKRTEGRGEFFLKTTLCRAGRLDDLPCLCFIQIPL